jgi:uncharacterized protein
MMKLSDGEKLILIMLCEIYEKLGIKKEVDPELVQNAIFDGNLWGLEWAFPGIFDRSEPSDQAVYETVNVLDMWSFLEEGYEKLSPEQKERVKKESSTFGEVRFRGWDGNRENVYIGIARFLVEHLGKFQKFKGRDLNSHKPYVAEYRRMLRVFEPLRKTLVDTILKVDDIIKILNAVIHPRHRNSASTTLN